MKKKIVENQFKQSVISGEISVKATDKNYHKEIFNVGSNELNFSIKEVALAIGDQIKTEKITFGEKDEDQRSYFVDRTTAQSAVMTSFQLPQQEQQFF